MHCINLDTGVFVGRAYGQYGIAHNGRELVNGCDILCATPGRLLHFISEEFVRLTFICRNAFIWIFDKSLSV